MGVDFVADNTVYPVFLSIRILVKIMAALGFFSEGDACVQYTPRARQVPPLAGDLSVCYTDCVTHCVERVSHATRPWASPCHAHACLVP